MKYLNEQNIARKPFKNSSTSADSSDIKEFATNICRKYLTGRWRELTIDNIEFERVAGGLSNLLYLISLPEYLRKKIKDEPYEVLLRIYGQTQGNLSSDTVVAESVIFAILSERGWGPELYAIFPGGRLEQYIHALPLRTIDLANERVYRTIAKKMARIHAMSFPIEKGSDWIWNRMHSWIEICENSSKIRQTLNSFETNLTEEYDFLKNQTKNFNSPILFCHNDVNLGNILLRYGPEIDESNPRISLIDLEYCSYNYRAFDIANHFLEWTFDYTLKEHPFFEIVDNYPNETQRLNFIKQYLMQLQSSEDPNVLLREAELFTPLCNFFWALWSFANEGRKDIEFGYLEYGVIRFKSYLRQKQGLLRTL